MSEESQDKCPECGSKKFIRDYDVAEVVCINCGFVVAAKLADRGPEWRAFDLEELNKRERVGRLFTYTIHDKGLQTMIGRHSHDDVDAFGKKISPQQKTEIYRLRKWQRRSRVSDATERNLSIALAEMRTIANHLNLPKNTIETASVVYRKAVKEHLIRGRSIQGMTSAAVYIACRQCGVARSQKEIVEASNIDKKTFGQYYRFLAKELDYFFNNLPSFKPSQYVTKLSSQLTMQGKVEEIAQKILVTARELKLTSGRGPSGIAAAATYIASVLSGERKTQREIAELAQVTEVTIRNRYKELAERLMFEITL